MYNSSWCVSIYVSMRALGSMMEWGREEEVRRSRGGLISDGLVSVVFGGGGVDVTAAEMEGRRAKWRRCGGGVCRKWRTSMGLF